MPIHARSIAVFGSVVAKTWGFNSDIDALVTANNKDEAAEIIAQKQEKFNKKFGNAVSAYVITESEFSRKNTDLVKGIIKNHIMVKGDEL